MSAALYFDYVYEASAAQETVVTVSGESQAGVSGAVADETVVVSIPKATLDSLITVGAQGTTGVGYPALTLDWTTLSAQLDPKWAALLAVSDTPTTFDDDSTPPVAIRTLQKVFATEGFTFGDESSLLLSIPPEAISRVGVTGAIGLVDSSTASLSLEAMVGSSTVLGPAVVATTSDNLDGAPMAVRGLFLQALAAGRYKQSSTSASSSQNLASTPAVAPGFDFQASDKITVYTRLTLNKTRRYIPDPADQLPGQGGMAFKINGTDTVIDDVDDTLTSDPKMWTVAWELTCSVAQ